MNELKQFVYDGMLPVRVIDRDGEPYFVLKDVCEVLGIQNAACCRIILTCKPKFWAIENPANGMLRKWLGEPDYIFDPWQFGHNYQKGTALWGEFAHPIPAIKEKPEGMKKFSMLYSKEIYPEFYGTYTRQERRAITPPGFAKAFYEANN